jgi:tetratricopeptide (TPR) repeat protein
MPRPNATTTLAAAGALGLLLLAGCHGGHGQYVKEEMSKSQMRVAEMKAANEYQQAYQSYCAGDLDKARKSIEQCLQINPSVAKSHVLRARILIEQSELEESVNSLLRAEALDPRSVDAQYYLGIVYERFTEPEKALERFTKAADLEPTNPQYAVAAAETLMDLHRLPDAEQFLTTRSTAYEHNAGVKQTLGHIAMLGGDTAKACRCFEEARLLAPDDNGVLEDLVRAQIATCKFGDAEFNITRLMKVKVNADRRDLKLLRARCLLNLDRSVEARSALLDLTSDDAGQKDVESWVLLGNTSYVLRDLNRVRMAYTRVIALAPDRTEGYMLRALWQRKQGDLPGALASVDKACERRGSDCEPVLLKGVILREMGRMAEAKVCFQTVVAADPQNEPAKKALASVSEGQ